MGVKGLWRLLLPIGRRISMETLYGKVLAIDVSIWLIQFVKAMRDMDSGKVLVAAHLIGFIKRLCKLRYYNIKPIFVFDGMTPEIKKREVILRNKRRESYATLSNETIQRLAKRILFQQLNQNKQQQQQQISTTVITANNSGVVDDNTNNESNNSGGAYVDDFNPGKGRIATATAANSITITSDVLHDENNNQEDDIVSKNYNESNDATTTLNNDNMDLVIQLEQEEEQQRICCNDEEIAAAVAAEYNDDNEYLIEYQDDCFMNNNNKKKKKKKKDKDNEEIDDWNNNDNDFVVKANDNDDDDDDNDSDSNDFNNDHDDDNDIDNESHYNYIQKSIELLPSNRRKEYIELMKRKQRMRSRKEFMPVAANPISFSQIQMKNFLRSTKLNHSIIQIATTITNKQQNNNNQNHSTITTNNDFDDNDNDDDEESNDNIKNIHSNRNYKNKTKKRITRFMTSDQTSKVELIREDNDDDEDEVVNDHTNVDNDDDKNNINDGNNEDKRKRKQLLINKLTSRMKQKRKKQKNNNNNLITIHNSRKLIRCSRISNIKDNMNFEYINHNDDSDDNEEEEDDDNDDDDQISFESCDSNNDKVKLKFSSTHFDHDEDSSNECNDKENIEKVSSSSKMKRKTLSRRMIQDNDDDEDDDQDIESNVDDVKQKQKEKISSENIVVDLSFNDNEDDDPSDVVAEGAGFLNSKHAIKDGNDDVIDISDDDGGGFLKNDDIKNESVMIETNKEMMINDTSSIRRSNYNHNVYTTDDDIVVDREVIDVESDSCCEEGGFLPANQNSEKLYHRSNSDDDVKMKPLSSSNTSQIIVQPNQHNTNNGVRKNDNNGTNKNNDEKYAQELEDRALAEAMQHAEYEETTTTTATTNIGMQLSSRQTNRNESFSEEEREEEEEAIDFQEENLKNSDSPSVHHRQRHHASEFVKHENEAHAEILVDSMTEPDGDLNVNIDNESEEDDINWEDGAPEESEFVNEQEFTTTKPVLSEHMTLSLPSNDHEVQADEPQEVPTTESVLVDDQPIHATIFESDEESDALSEQDQSVDDDILANNEFETYPNATVSPNQLSEAFKQAHETASNLTNWAGRAFRRAVLEVTGEEVTPTVVSNTRSDPNSQITISPANINAHQEKASVQLSELEPTKDLIIAGELEEKSEKVSGLQSLDIHNNFTLNDPFTQSVLLENEAQWTSERNRKERDMDTVTDEMKEEVMQLLQLFGVPYIEAPAEAEAQCVALEQLGLVHGIVTEDSDVFVFGGKTVYKNIFEEQKYVEVYAASDAEKEMNINHNSFVALAMLLGGDYTEGVKGVGIVNAMEVLESFDVTDNLVDGLTKFRKWLDGFDPINSHTGNSKKKRIKNDDNDEKQEEQDEEEISKELRFHSKHRSARTRWIPPSSFPSEQVIKAYIEPVVDKSEERFTWGIPDIDNLILFCNKNIGWRPDDTMNLLNPVIEQLKKASNGGLYQTRLDSYIMKYEDGIKFANIRSKRLREVLEKNNNSSSNKEKDDDNRTLTK